MNTTHSIKITGLIIGSFVFFMQASEPISDTIHTKYGLTAITTHKKEGTVVFVSNFPNKDRNKGVSGLAVIRKLDDHGNASEVLAVFATQNGRKTPFDVTPSEQQRFCFTPESPLTTAERFFDEQQLESIKEEEKVTNTPNALLNVAAELKKSSSLMDMIRVEITKYEQSKAH